MKYLIKNTFLIILTCLLCSSILMACSPKQLKTIIIEDDKATKNEISSSQKNNNFKVNKIYSYDSRTFENDKIINKYLFGWTDNENIASIVFSDEKSELLTLNNINYKYKFTNEISKISCGGLVLSPDGKKLVYIDKKNPFKLFIKDLNTKVDKLICEIDSKFQYEGSFRWSNNSKYIGFSVYLPNSNINTAYVYDVNNNKLRKIPLLGCKLYSFPQIIVADDGKNMLINLYDTRDNSLMYFLELTSDVFDTRKNMKLKTILTQCSEFINSNKILFIDASTNSLNIYDINSKKTIIVDKNVRNFNVSNDSKKIAYVKYLPQYGSDVYACDISGDKVLNKELVFKGFLPFRMYWSQDNKKILINGGTYSDVNMDYNQMGNNISGNPFNSKNLIIEFY